jgi:proline iminopeptidase
MKTILLSLALCLLLSQSTFAESGQYQSFDNNGVKIAYRVFGTGSPLIVINGGPGRSSDTFTKLAESLQSKTNKQVILFDQRGTGKSKLTLINENTISLDLMISDLEALRKHLGFNKVAILGHSFGGMYAMAYASKYPESIDALILSCSGGVDLSWKEYALHNMLSRLTEKERKKHEFWTSPEQQKIDPIKADLEALRILIPAYIYHRKFVSQLEHDLINLNYYVPVVNQLVWKSMENYNLKEDLKVLHAPTLIIDGRQDILGEAVPITIHESIINSTIEFLDKCSHYPWLDSPDKYFSLITKFLNQ